MNSRNINDGLANRAEEFARMIFPNGKRAGNEWLVGSLAGEIGKSLSVALIGPKAGCWIDRASGESGDALALWMIHYGQDFPTALRSAGEWLGIAIDPRQKRHQSNPQPISPPVKPPLTLPADWTSGTKDDWAELASLRRVSDYAVWSAANHGALLFGTCCGKRSWILTDRRRLIAEARRLDGKVFAAGGGLAERKSHTIKGSTKSWPIGLDLDGLAVENFRAVMIVEGGPDYLAALHFVLDGKGDCLPIAMLGGGAAMHPDAVAILKGKRIRFYPHRDDAGAEAVERWIDQIDSERTNCDYWEFEGKKADGALIKDLNDCTSIAAEDAGKLEGLLP